MRQKLSTLQDGELDDSESEALFSALQQDDEELRRCCCEYHLVGEALRGEPMPDRDISDRVMTAIREGSAAQDENSSGEPPTSLRLEPRQHLTDKENRE